MLSLIQHCLDVLNVIIARTIHNSIIRLHILDEAEQVRLVKYLVTVNVINIEGKLLGEGNDLVNGLVLANNTLEQLLVELGVTERQGVIPHSKEFVRNPLRIFVLEKLFQLFLFYPSVGLD